MLAQQLHLLFQKPMAPGQFAEVLAHKADGVVAAGDRARSFRRPHLTEGPQDNLCRTPVTKRQRLGHHALVGAAALSTSGPGDAAFREATARRLATMHLPLYQARAASEATAKIPALAVAS